MKAKDEIKKKKQKQNQSINQHCLCEQMQKKNLVIILEIKINLKYYIIWMFEIKKNNKIFLHINRAKMYVPLE